MKTNMIILKALPLILILLLGSCQSASFPIFIDYSSPKGDIELERWCQYPDTRELVLCKDQQNRGNSQCISDCDSTFEKCYALTNDDIFNELFKEHKCKGNKNRCYRQCTLTLGTSLKERKWCQNLDTNEYILCEEQQP